MTHTALKMARDALADLHLNVSEAMRTGGWVPTPLHQSFWQSMVEAANAIAAIDALQSTHPADASIVGAQIDMRDSVPSAVPVGPWETKREAAGHANAMQQANDLGAALALRLADGLAGLGTMSTRLRHLYDESAAMLRAIACTAPTAPAPAQASAEPAAVFDDPRVQTVYDILCDADDVPPPEQHWEGWAARRIVDALAAPAPAQASPRDDYEEGDSFAGMDATPPAAAAPLAQPLTDTRILEMAAEAETPAWGEWYTDEDALFRFARAVEAHKGQP